MLTASLETACYRSCVVWQRNWKMRDLERPVKGGMGQAFGKQLEQDAKRRREQV